MSKPADWPKNEREFELELIKEKLQEFEENPTYKTREVIIVILCKHDLNDTALYGEVRLTDYEVDTINFLYLKGAVFQMNSPKIYLYDLIMQTTRLFKMSACIGDEKHTNMSSLWL